jgi:hypothetical protein
VRHAATTRYHRANGHSLQGACVSNCHCVPARSHVPLVKGPTSASSCEIRARSIQQWHNTIASCSTVTQTTPKARVQATSRTTPPTIAAAHIPAAASPIMLLPLLMAGDGALAAFDAAAVLDDGAVFLPAPAVASLIGSVEGSTPMLSLWGAAAVANAWESPGDAVGSAAPRGPSSGVLTPADGADTMRRLQIWRCGGL